MGDLSFMLAEAADEERTRFTHSEDGSFMNDLLALADEHHLSLVCSALPAQTHAYVASTRGIRCCTPAFFEVAALGRAVATGEDIERALMRCCSVLRHPAAQDVLGSVPADPPAPEGWQQLQQMCAPAVLSHVSRTLRSHIVVVAMNANGTEWFSDFACADPEWLSQPLQLVYAVGRSATDGGVAELLRHLDGMEWAKEQVSQVARAIDNEVLG